MCSLKEEFDRVTAECEECKQELRHLHNDRNSLQVRQCHSVQTLRYIHCSSGGETTQCKVQQDASSKLCGHSVGDTPLQCTGRHFHAYRLASHAHTVNNVKVRIGGHQYGTSGTLFCIVWPS